MLFFPSGFLLRSFVSATLLYKADEQGPSVGMKKLTISGVMFSFIHSFYICLRVLCFALLFFSSGIRMRFEFRI